MAIYYWCIFGLWLLFIVLWIVSSLSAKKSKRGGAFSRGVLLRLIVVALVIFVLRYTGTGTLRHARIFLVNTNPVLGIAGVALCAIGIGLALYARVYLGSNWGLPMARKANPELVTRGPYAYIRVRCRFVGHAMLPVLGSDSAANVHGYELAVRE